jgi:hypothetical protein
LPAGATGLFATEVAASVLLITAHDRPFTGQPPSPAPAFADHAGSAEGK